jgi:KamA family protein
MPLPAADLLDTGRYRAYGPRQLNEIAARFSLRGDIVETARIVSLVLPFRVNDYVLSQLIDWDAVPEDPIFQMVFPQRGMLRAQDVRRLGALSTNGNRPALEAAVWEIRRGLNPHPSGQRELNVPRHGGADLPGLQHKYRETVLYFPQQGQTCHAYCNYCFRWAQFVGAADLRFAAPNSRQLVDYLRVHPEVTDVLVTGGDPMMMTSERLSAHIEPLLAIDTVRTIRIGTKSVAYWPQRFTTDKDADGVLGLFERVVQSGRSLAVMAHFSHSREVGTDAARAAMVRIRRTGAVLYCQAPLIAHVNDRATVWADLWSAEIAAGAVPYYQFVERDTGPYDYFKVPLADAVDIFRTAYRTLPGLARTVRGPVMSATPGKIVVDGVEHSPQGSFFRLRFLQARDPNLVGRPFRARYSSSASWLDQLDLDLPDTPADIVAAVATWT